MQNDGFDLAWERAVREIIPFEVIEKLKQYQYVLLFGAGRSGEYVWELLHKFGIQAVCFCDNSRQKQGKRLKGLPILSFTEALKRFPGAAVGLSSCFSDEIYSQIQREAPFAIKDTYFILNTLSWETQSQAERSGEPDYIRDHLEQFCAVCKMMEDERSREVLKGILNFRLTRDSAYLDKILNEGPTYFDASVISEDRKSRINVFVDAGGYNGETVEAFLNYKNGEYEQVICYEPDPRNAGLIREYIKKNNLANIEVRAEALWSSEKELFLNGGGLSGMVLEEPVTDRTENTMGGVLDHLGKERIDMIKMDIEGAELEALKGARNTIARDKPVLAISVYHRQEDLIAIPPYIQTLRPDYQFYLRPYFRTPFETVLYCV